jgi:hypothetical protein
VRFQSSGVADAPVKYSEARMEEYSEAVDLEGGATAPTNLFIGQLLTVGM